MKKRRLAYWGRTSSALVITMLGVVLLTIIVVAFMQTMSLSLTTSKSYTDIQRATLAAQAGVDTAIAQIALATGTNLAFVTGQTNFPSANTPVTVIGEGNLTNLDQMMPLISGPIDWLTNFGDSGFSNNFSMYTSALASGDPTQSVDVNTAYQFIQVTSDNNVYRAPWVTMTNTVGSKVSYTRYAYVVLDDSARINPALMTGTGTGFTNTTNWYTGSQDINATSLTNDADEQVLTASQMAQITASSNSVAYSDASLGETFANRAAYEAVKDLLTSRTNASFDVIPAWYPDGGKPKYNINDLATNPAYGSTPLARSLNIAGIITNNLPNFYMRDPALTAAGDKTTYVSRLAANMVDYINPDGTWGATDYSTNVTGISPQGHGVYPVMIQEMSYVLPGGAGDGTGTKYTSSMIVNQFWLSVWNPYTTPVTIKSASINISDRPGYSLGGGTNNVLPDYTNSVSVISGHNSANGAPPYVVNPNEFVVMGFVPQTNTIYGISTSSGPASVTVDASPPQLEQYSLTVNGQTTAQSGAMNPNRSSVNGGGLQHESEGLSTNYDWENDSIAVWGTEVGDPRFESYYNDIWNNTHDVTTAYTSGCSYWKGVDQNGGSKSWAQYIFPPPLESSVPVSTWANRDNMARSPNAVGSQPTSGQQTPDQLASTYNLANDSNAAPEVIRNGPMISIGELGHIFDPAYANDILTAVPPRTDGGGYSSAYSNGGARSLRIGAPEFTGATTNYITAPPLTGWNVNGERAIDLLDLFTVNNTYTSSTTGATNSSMIATNMMYGGAVGRINPNTASSNVLANVFSGIQITSDTGMSGGNRTLANPGYLAGQVISKRPYSSLSDLYQVMPLFDANTNYTPNFPMTTALNGFNWGAGATVLSYYPSTLNVFNRVHQEAFGKLVQHLTVQSRSYRIYVIGQMLDNGQKPRGSVAMEVGVYLQYSQASVKYDPVIQYVRLLK